MKKDVIVCIGTVGRPTFDKCYDHVMELKKRDPRVKKVVVIRDEPSQAAWLNKMREACKGYTWCLQVDEDMYVDPDCIKHLLELSKYHELKGSKILNASSMLYDLFLKENIGSLKMWRSSALKRFAFNDVMGSDRDIFARAKKEGYCNVSTDKVLGQHDSAPNIDVGSKKYYTYVKKIIKFSGPSKAKKFILNMENKKLNSDIINSAWRSFYENTDFKPEL